MAFLTVNGIDGLKKQFAALRANMEQQVMRRRQEVAAYLIERLMEDIPVWSGRTIESISINTSGALANLAPNDWPAPHSEYGHTSRLALGSEPMRAGAEAHARAEVSNALAPLDRSVFVTIHSTAWSLIEVAQAPNGKGRNTAVVSEIALARTKSEFGL